MIRPLEHSDIPACAEILCSVYNNDLWMCRWTAEKAAAYLADYVDAGKFIGFAAEEDGVVIGALFAHEKIWWNNDEVFIDEMFVRPDRQGGGIGTRLMEAVLDQVMQRGLAGVTLTTNRYAPAPAFYEKLGFAPCEHVMMMAKEC